MIPLPLITSAISLFVDKEKAPEIAKEVKERVFNKTNSASYLAISFIITQLTQNPNDHFYQFSFLFCVFMSTLRDTAHKAIKLLQK